MIKVHYPIYMIFISFLPLTLCLSHLQVYMPVVLVICSVIVPFKFCNHFYTLISSSTRIETRYFCRSHNRIWVIIAAGSLKNDIFVSNYVQKKRTHLSSWIRSQHFLLQNLRHYKIGLSLIWIATKFLRQDCSLQCLLIFPFFVCLYDSHILILFTYHTTFRLYTSIFTVLNF